MSLASLFLHRERLAAVPIAHLFEQNPQRAAQFSLQAAGLFLDYAKQNLDTAALEAVLAYFQQQGLAALQDKLASGAIVNVSEQRAALHMACRAQAGDCHLKLPPTLAKVFVEQRQHMLDLAQQIRQGQLTGATGRVLNQVVHIGIGGSDLGPLMAATAFRPLADGPGVLFLSTLDGAALQQVTAQLDPHRTLILVASKTFTTLETLANATSLVQWLAQQTGQSVQSIKQHQCLAITAKPDTATRWGIAPGHVLPFHEAVGGRFSLWSAIGLPLAIAVGPGQFEQMLAGARAMDQHFFSAPWANNMPMLLAAIDFWNRSIQGFESRCVAPYAQDLQHLPAYLQQLEMESNGKQIGVDGQPVSTSTSPVVWGQTGTNAQHAFFQLLHQGSSIVPTEFIAVAKPHHAWADHHQGLLANCFAQSRALMLGCTDTDPQKTFPGNRPSTTILLPTLDAYSLGALIAAYEHKTVALGWAWGINSFDQWGVELGKAMAKDINQVLAGHGDMALDGSTAQLMAWAQSRAKV
jgi:glucose-6-phosphate isomerase